MSKKYTGPQLPKDFLNVSSRANCSDNSSPSYVDGDGRLYDTFYRRCEQSEAGRLVQRLARLPFPSPDAEGAYIDFNSYEAAVLEWKKQVTTALGHLTLPQLMGRAYPRPRVFKMVCRAATVSISDTHHRTRTRLCSHEDGCVVVIMRTAGRGVRRG